MTTSNTEEEIKNEKISFLKDNIDKRINSFKEKSKYYRKISWIYKIVSSVLGGLIAILLGFKIDNAFYKDIIIDISIVFGSMITIVSTFESFWEPRNLWIRFTMTTNDLRSLKYELDYLEKNGIDKITIDEIDSISNRYNEILKDANKEWNKNRNNNKI